MGTSTAEERETFQPNGSVLAQRISNVGDNVFSLRGERN